MSVPILKIIAEESKLVHNNLVEIHEKGLIEKSLLRERPSSTDLARAYPYYRLTDLGYGLCKYIDEADDMHPELKKIISYLKETDRYRKLLDRISDPIDKADIFEMLFAHTFEINNMVLEYEVNIKPDSDTTVDFVFKDGSGSPLCFELTRPEMSEVLKGECEPKDSDVEGIKEWEVLLESGQTNEYLRPEALTIRMQEKILGKVEKFPDSSDDCFSIIVVDSSNFHFGHFDSEDCRMVIFGKTKLSLLQENWEGKLIEGMLDKNYSKRGASEFRKRTSAVIFIPKVNEDSVSNLFDGAFIVLNTNRSNKHLKKLKEKISKYKIFNKIEFVDPT